TSRNARSIPTSFSECWLAADADGSGGGGERDEARGDRDEGECLGERDAEEHQTGQTTLELGLASDRLDRLADDDAHADGGADRGEAECDGGEVSNDVHGISFSVMGSCGVCPAGPENQCSSTSESWM